jgi:uracil phosphoribosyltransferase
VTVEIVAHPALQVALATLRDRHTPPAAFRAAGRTAGAALMAAASADLATAAVGVESPLEAATGARLRDVPLIVPILRAGLLFLDAAYDLLPEAQLGLVGLARDETTFEAHRYLDRLPDAIGDRPAFVLEPMVATGGSAGTALDLLAERGARDVRVVSLIAAPDGVTELGRRHPGARLWVGAVDDRLDDHAFIRPGLGDCGDRAFGPPS